MNEEIAKDSLSGLSFFVLLCWDSKYGMADSISGVRLVIALVRTVFSFEGTAFPTL
jgi:hypothetical protein